MPHEVAMGLLHVGLEHLVGQLVKPATPDHVVHAAMQAELMAFGLKRLQLGNEGEAYRAGQRRLQEEAGPSGLLDEMHRFAVGELRLGAGDALPQPFPQVGGPAHVDEEGVGHAEIAADGADARESVGDADPVIHIPPEHEEPVAHLPPARPGRGRSARTARRCGPSRRGGGRAPARPGPSAAARFGSSSSEPIASARAPSRPGGPPVRSRRAPPPRAARRRRWPPPAPHIPWPPRPECRTPPPAMGSPRSPPPGSRAEARRWGPSRER